VVGRVLGFTIVTFSGIILVMKNKTSTQSLLIKLYQNPQYKGKHIIIIGGRVYATKTGKAKSELLDKLLKKFPKETPTITYIPKVDTLILLIL